MLSKGKGIFKNIYNERLDEIEELTKKINYDNLNFIAESGGNETNFTNLEDLAVILNDIKTDKLKLEEAKKVQEDFNKQLKNIRKGNKSEKQKKS